MENLEAENLDYQMVEEQHSSMNIAIFLKNIFRLSREEKYRSGPITFPTYLLPRNMKIIKNKIER